MPASVPYQSLMPWQVHPKTVQFQTGSHAPAVTNDAREDGVTVYERDPFFRDPVMVA